MKKNSKIILAALFLLIVIFKVYGEDLPTDWKRYDLPVGSCTCEFPSAPAHMIKMQMINENEAGVMFDLFIAPKGDDALFLLIIASYPTLFEEKDYRICLEGFIAGLVQEKSESRLLFSEIKEEKDQLCIDFGIDNGVQDFIGKAFVRKNHIYLQAVLAKKDHLEIGDLDRFLASFSFLHR